MIPHPRPNPIKAARNRLAGHLKRHWPKHLSAVSLIAVVLTFTAGMAAPAIYHHVHGGLARGPLPPPIRISGGFVPPSYSLAGSIVRVHNQGASNSCVGQTLSTILEIETAEFAANHPNFARKHPYFHLTTPFSAGYIWNQATGGLDTGTTYNNAFQVLQDQGDAPLALFPPDGATDWAAMPGKTARTYAHYHRITQWNSILPTDRHTIEAEIVHGRPVALAIPVYDSFYQNWAGGWPLISQNTGAFWFWHSITIVGYNPSGVIILNSWGSQWGYHGLATLSWSLIAADQAGLVAQTPHWPNVAAWLARTHPKATPTPRPTRMPVPTATMTPTAIPTATPFIVPTAKLTPAGTFVRPSPTAVTAATPVPAGHVPNP